MMISYSLFLVRSICFFFVWVCVNKYLVILLFPLSKRICFACHLHAIFPQRKQSTLIYCRQFYKQLCNRQLAGQLKMTLSDICEDIIRNVRENTSLKYVIEIFLFYNVSSIMHDCIYYRVFQYILFDYDIMNKS